MKTIPKVASLGPWLRSGDPGRASDFIVRLRKHRKLWGKRVVLFCRVSSRTQKKRKNLADQEKFLRKVVARYGCIVVAVYHCTGSGWIDSHEYCPIMHPAHLMRARALAAHHDAFLLAESTDRFVRPRWYNSQTDPTRTATRKDLSELKWLTAGVTLATALRPDAPLTVVRRHQQDRGKKGKGNNGGRPKTPRAGDTKRRREEMKPRVLDLAGRLSVPEIVAELGVPRRTVYRWIKEGR